MTEVPPSQGAAETQESDRYAPIPTPSRQRHREPSGGRAGWVARDEFLRPISRRMSAPVYTPTRLRSPPRQLGPAAPHSPTASRPPHRSRPLRRTPATGHSSRDSRTARTLTTQDLDTADVSTGPQPGRLTGVDRDQTSPAPRTVDIEIFDYEYLSGAAAAPCPAAADVSN